MAANMEFGNLPDAAVREFLEREAAWREIFPDQARTAICNPGLRRFRASVALLLSRLGWDYVGDAQIYLFAASDRNAEAVVVFGAVPEQPEEEIGRVVHQAARLRAFLRACGLAAIQVRSLVVMGTEPGPELLTAAAVVEVRLLAAEELARLSAAPAANRKTLSAMITEKPVVSAVYA